MYAAQLQLFLLLILSLFCQGLRAQTYEELRENGELTPKTRECLFLLLNVLKSCYKFNLP